MEDSNAPFGSWLDAGDAQTIGSHGRGASWRTPTAQLSRRPCLSARRRRSCL